MMIKPLATAYQGTVYRSRTEARWAVFFADNDIPFNYEAEGFDAGGVWYVPDFWLPAAKVWFEVKPDDPTATEIKKAQLLAKGTGRLVFVAPGNPRSGIGLYGYSPTGRVQKDWKFAYSHEEGVGFLTDCLWRGNLSIRLNGTVNEVGCYGHGPDQELEKAGKHQFSEQTRNYSASLWSHGNRRIIR